MRAIVLRDFGQALERTQAQALRPSEAELGLQEIKVLRADVDLLAPPETAESIEHLVEAYRGNYTSGDQLRLPQLTNLDGASMRSAISRILAVDASRSLGTTTQQAQEERMRGVLAALEATTSDIRRMAIS